MDYYKRHCKDGNISNHLYSLIGSTCENVAFWEEMAKSYLTFKDKFYKFGRLTDLLYIASSRGSWHNTELNKKLHRAVITNNIRDNFYKIDASYATQLSQVVSQDVIPVFFNRNIIDAIIERALLKEGFTVYGILSTGTKLFSKDCKVFYMSPLNPFLIKHDSLYNLFIYQGWAVFDFSVNDLTIINNLKTYGYDPNVVKKQVTIHI